MSLLTEQEIEQAANNFCGIKDCRITFSMYTLSAFARAIESAVIEKIKAQGATAWLHHERQESDVVTTKFKHVWGEAVVGSLALYDIPLYRLPEGD